MAWDQAGPFFARLSILGPLLYIGLWMTINPAGFMTFAAMFASALHTFGQRLHGFSWQEPLHEPDPVSISSGTRNAVRFTGVFLAACALLLLVSA